MTPKHIIIVSLTLTLLAGLTACSTSPTGRSQLKLFSKGQLANMGGQAFDSMKSNQSIKSSGAQNQLVTCVADTLTRLVPPEVYDGEWEVVVFDDPQVNAFALPGGKIGVYTGLLEVAKNQHQLAAVIGHEIGHVIAEHGNERMSNTALIGLGLEVTNRMLQENQIASSGMIMAAIGLGVQVGVQLPFSRTHESEADQIGLDLMARAGFDPRESVALWENMEKASGGKRQPELLSTHPNPSTRIRDLQGYMPNALNLSRAVTNKPQCE